MLRKSWKIRARSGGIRRKILKKYARIMNSNDTINKEERNYTSDPSCRHGKTEAHCTCHERCTHHGSGSVEIVCECDLELASCSHLKCDAECTYQKRVTHQGSGSAGIVSECNLELVNLNSDTQPLSSEESDNDSDVKKYLKEYTFREKIRSWAIERNITQIALKDLAGIVNELLPQILPADPRSILKTPRYVSIKKIEGGEYWHNEITTTLSQLLDKWTDVPEQISLNFNLDGLPIFKSSKKEFWPILCNIYENSAIKPFVVGVYYGAGKPKNLQTYLEDFIIDVCNLLDKGISLGQNSERKVTVKIRCFICDSPARAYLKGVCNFNGKHGCMKCVVVGEYSHNSHTVVFSDTNCAQRTNNGFRRKEYGAHHKTDSPLLSLPIDMVQDFPVGDSLHLIDLGIMKRLLVGWRDGNFGKYLTKWRASQIEQVNNFLNGCVLPSEIHRAVRGLDCLAFWKASEFRTFLFYLSVIILPKVLTNAAYSHFLKFYCGVTICMAESKQFLLPLAKELLKSFVIHYKDFYGADYVTSNVHNLIHVTDEVQRFGPLHTFSAYPFENKLHMIKRLLRDGKNPLSQIANRIKEATEGCADSNNHKGKFIPEYPRVTENRNHYKILHLPQFKVSPKRNDRYILTFINEIVKVSNIVNTSSEVSLNGVRISVKEDMFTFPINSSRLNIYKAAKIDNENCIMTLYPQDIKCKLVCIDHIDEYLYFIPLLHTTQ